MNSPARSYLTKLLTLLLSTAAPLAAAEAQNAGRVGAVNQDATGTPPGAGSRSLVVGSNVIFKERIQTSASGSAQVLLPDQSTLNVGRNSSIVIDELVYDPNAGTGKMIATVARGALRFVGGQISHTAGVTINTPVATVGIRGGVATFVYPIPPSLAATIPGGRGELVVCNVGSCVIKNGTGEMTVPQGYATFVSGPNDPIPEPFRMPDNALQIIMAMLTSGPGQKGGVVQIPTDTMAARQGYGNTNLNDPARPPGSDPLGYFSIFDGGNAAAKNKAGSNQTNQTQPHTPYNPGPGPYY
jgi:hypothetical protein